MLSGILYNWSASHISSCYLRYIGLQVPATFHTYKSKTLNIKYQTCICMFWNSWNPYIYICKYICISCPELEINNGSMWWLHQPLHSTIVSWVRIRNWLCTMLWLMLWKKGVEHFNVVTVLGNWDMLKSVLSVMLVGKGYVVRWGPIWNVTCWRRYLETV